MVRIYSIIKKTHKSLAESNLEWVLDNMVEKHLIEYHYRNGSCNCQELPKTLLWLSKQKKVIMELYQHYLEMIDPLLGKHKFRMKKADILTCTQLQLVIFQVSVEKFVRNSGHYNIKFYVIILIRGVMYMWNYRKQYCK